MTAPLASPGPAAARDLLAWYRRHARRLPWRVPPGARVAVDPYRVWLSEVMLQQTTVAAVLPYFHDFLRRWPTVSDLAAADEAEVMKAWAGLGYYSRARNLKRCADAVAATYGGRFPETADGLAALPGIGPYTAAAIAAIAFGRPEPVIDGNVERVVARLIALAAPPKTALPAVRETLTTMLPPEAPGDFAQALMDLGATVCTPRRPACDVCPLCPSCAAARRGDPEAFPVRAAKAARPLRRGAAFVAVRADGAVLLRRRPPKGLLGGMSEVPTTAWSTGFDPAGALAAAPLAADWRRLPAPVRHGFTHFMLELDVWRARLGARAAPPEGAWWSAPAALPREALPTAMRKVVAAACPELGLGRHGRDRAHSATER